MAFEKLRHAGWQAEHVADYCSTHFHEPTAEFLVMKQGMVLQYIIKGDTLSVIAATIDSQQNTAAINAATKPIKKIAQIIEDVPPYAIVPDMRQPYVHSGVKLTITFEDSSYYELVATSSEDTESLRHFAIVLRSKM